MTAPTYTPSRVHRLALRVAATVALPVGLVAAIGAGVPGGVRTGLLAGVLMALVASVATYAAVSRQIAGRLELARRTLREARKRRFDALASLPGATGRDELDALIHQVGRAGRTLQREIERLERVESYRREFLGDVSHELRTPIFAVTGFAETLLDGALDDDRVRRRFVEKIYANASRLDALTRDLSDISKLETGRLQVTREPFDLGALATEVVEGLEHAAREHHVELAVRVPATLPPVLGDRDRIRQVLTNLVENAVKYNEAGGHVEVAARLRDTGDVRIAVVDDGIGIPQDAINRLTERFFRVDKSRSRAEGGTGLGLAIVKHILEAHGQRLDVESRVGYGSAFAFALPPAPVGSGDGAMSARQPAPSERDGA
ncbi:sensor histidine kinase [Rubrivirga marina]|uniref:sensor histidine kinase n=1 Tax=Rubrivirga marina TaxID=1196024 RepID=UPI0015CE3E7D|nr:ATP-binding protein [Rubrivirga marina]